MDVLLRMRHSCPVGDHTVRRSDVETKTLPSCRSGENAAVRSSFKKATYYKVVLSPKVNHRAKAKSVLSSELRRAQGDPSHWSRETPSIAILAKLQKHCDCKYLFIYLLLWKAGGKAFSVQNTYH